MTVQNCKRGAKRAWGKGENRTSCGGVNDKPEREPQRGEANGHQRRRGGGLTSTPRPEPSWEQKGKWRKVTRISRGVEISIAGGGGEMVRGLSVDYFFFFL